MRRRRLRKVEVTLAQQSGPLDLRSNTLLPRGANVAPVEVDNPNKRGEKIIIWRNRKDPLSFYASCTPPVIDEPQRLAGEHWRRCYELCVVGSVRGYWLRDYVDQSAGTQYEPISDNQVRASKDLARAAKKLGEKGVMIVKAILIDGFFAKQLANGDGERGERYYVDRFRECLQDLAIVFTYR